MEPSDVLTSPEVSQILGCSIRTIHRRVDDGELTALRKLPGPNGAFLFERREIDRYRAERGLDASTAAAS